MFFGISWTSGFAECLVTYWTPLCVGLKMSGMVSAKFHPEITDSTDGEILPKQKISLKSLSFLNQICLKKR